MEDRDPVVARALSTMPVPPHRPDFWQRLDAALADVAPRPRAVPITPPVSAAEPPAAADSGTGATVVELRPAQGTDEARPAKPSRVRPALRLVSSAAVVAALVAGGIVVAGRDDDSGPDLSSVSEPSGSTDPTILSTPTTAAEPPSPPQSTSETTVARAEGDGDPHASPENVVLAFVDALGAGDLDAAASFLGMWSEQTAVATHGSVEAFLRDGVTEGHGSWAASPDRQVDVIPIRPGDAVVVLQGTVRPEGNEEHRVAAFPARHAESADAWFVEPWATGQDDPAIRLLDGVSPQPDPDGVRAIGSGRPLEVTVPAAGTVYFVLDGAEPVAVQTTPSSGGHVATWTPDGSRRGAAMLTIAYIADATFTAAALPVSIG